MSHGTQSSSGSLPTTNTNELAGHAASDVPQPAPRKSAAPCEHGGRGGLDPTRYGDWEKNGRCIDF
ncbi:MAG: DUF1674 domain-containing protein [Steroidobacteraceae bacterium]